ncbi:MAG: hypothetical protein N2491_07785 [Negativicutes bacterium]|nr:hypothetical protein [Negativicutes bacterium]
MDVKTITRAALLLALTLVFQSLRFVLPITPIASTVVVGSLVNACLVVATYVAGIKPTLAIAAAAPAVAYLQQLLPLPVLILPVALGNIIYVAILAMQGKQRWAGLVFAALAKSLFLYLVFDWILALLNLPPKLAASLKFVMSWPQFITAIGGGILAFLILGRLFPANKT